MMNASRQRKREVRIDRCSQYYHQHRCWNFAPAAFGAVHGVSVVFVNANALSFLSFFPDSLVYVVDDEYYKVSLRGFVFEGVKGKGEREEMGKIGGNGEI